MALPLRAGTTITVKVGPFLDATDGVTPETALTVAVELSKNGGAFANRNSVTATAHDAEGFYNVELNTTDTNTTGRLQLKSLDAAAVPVWHEYVVMAAQAYDSLVLGTDLLDISLAQWLGVAPLALVSQRVDASVGAMAAGTVTAAAIATNAIDDDAIATGAIASTAFAAGAIDAAAIAANAIGASELASDAVAEIVTAVWGALAASFNSADTMGQIMQAMETGQAQAGAAGTITLDAGSVATDDYYNGTLIKTTSGTGLRQSRFITDYVGATRVATVSANWVVTPDSTTQYVVLPFATIPGASAPTVPDIVNGVWNEPVASHVTPGTFGQVLQPLRTGTAQAGAGTTITLDAGAHASNGFYAGALVFLTGGIGAGQARRIQAYNGTTKVATVPIWLVAPDATSQFVVAPDAPAWNDARAEFFATGSFGEGVNLRTSAISSGSFAAGAVNAAALATDAVAEIADGVWDEPIAGHLGAGSTGAALNGAGAAGDPWTTPLPGAYGVGTAGNIVGNNLDVAVSTRSSLTAAAAADAVWDEPIASHLTVGSTGAKLDSLTSAVSPSAVPFTYTLTRSDNAAPIDDAQVDVYGDVSLTLLVTSGRTDANGQVTFFLDPATTFWLVRSKAGFTFQNPDQETTP